MAETKRVTIRSAPSQPSMETVFGLVLMVRSPRSKRSITVMLNPALADYQAKLPTRPGVRVNEVIVVGTDEEDTKTLFFDLDATCVHKVRVGDRDYEIQLVTVGEYEFDTQQFPEYEFAVTEQ